jgi:hypothetical protein
MKVVTLAILTAIAAASVSGDQATQKTPARPEDAPVRVKGRLLRKDKSPALGKGVYLLVIHKNHKGDWLKVEALVEPGGDVADKGAFVVRVDRKYLAAGVELSLWVGPPFSEAKEGTGVPMVPQPLRRGGLMLTFTADPRTKELDLGEIILEEG